MHCARASFFSQNPHFSNDKDDQEELKKEEKELMQPNTNHF